MSRRLVLQVQAEVDIDEAMFRYENERAGLGVEFIQDVNVLLERVEENPFQFPIVHQETRRGMLGRFPYGIFFTVDDRNSSFSQSCICIGIRTRGNVADDFVWATG